MPDLLDETAVIDSIGICTPVTPIVFTETPEAYSAVLGKEATEEDMRASAAESAIWTDPSISNADTRRRRTRSCGGPSKARSTSTERG